MRTETTNYRTLKLVCGIIIFLGVAGKFYGINAPWKTNDHYNFGGIRTSVYAECLGKTPLSVSKAIPHYNCWNNETRIYYRSHPPTILFGLWGWTSVFGHAEWSYRLFILTLSTLNIFLVFRIGRILAPTGIYPWLAAAFQSSFLAGLYFGTHLDFIGEFSVVFVLIMTIFAIQKRMTAATAFALLAGISSWPGYIALGPLFLYACLIQKGRKRVLAASAFGVILVLGTMMWLHETTSIFSFLHEKLLNPGYISNRERGWLEPVRFLRNFITSQARLLGPTFCAFAFFELIRGSGKPIFTDWRNRWKNLDRIHHAALLAGGTGILYALIGHEYVMVHVFLYLFLVPGLALLCARFVERVIHDSVRGNGLPLGKSDKVWMICLVLVFTALYPYGIFKSNAAHDAFNSVILILSSISLIWIVTKRQLQTKSVLSFMFVGLAANFSQTVNYRNEPDTERAFCEQARAEYQRTGLPVHTKERASDAKTMVYCRDIPIVYESTKED